MNNPNPIGTTVVMADPHRIGSSTASPPISKRSLSLALALNFMVACIGVGIVDRKEALFHIVLICVVLAVHFIARAWVVLSSAQSNETGGLDQLVNDEQAIWGAWASLLISLAYVAGYKLSGNHLWINAGIEGTSISLLSVFVVGNRVHMLGWALSAASCGLCIVGWWMSYRYLNAFLCLGASGIVLTDAFLALTTKTSMWPSRASWNLAGATLLLLIIAIGVFSLARV